MSELAVALFAASTDSHLLDEPRSARFERFRAELDERTVLADLGRRGIRWVARGAPGYPRVFGGSTTRLPACSSAERPS